MIKQAIKLFRYEALRLLVSVDTQGTKYQKPDTDFKVGYLFIILAEKYNYNFYWEHVNDIPQMNLNK
jgi:hypothetical protein